MNEEIEIIKSLTQLVNTKVYDDLGKEMPLFDGAQGTVIAKAILILVEKNCDPLKGIRKEVYPKL